MTQSRSIALSRKLVNQILHHAQQFPDQEVCGLIGGRDGSPEHCYPVRNVADQPECRFLLDAGEQIAAMRAMRERGEGLCAIFHSHPATGAEPSPADLQQSEYPDALYLIISLGTKGVLEMRGFRFEGTLGYTEIPLHLEAPE